MKIKQQRMSSDEYRSWSITHWCRHVQSLGVSSLSAWAVNARSSYSHAVTLGVQRKVARQLGWLPKLEKNEMQRMSDAEFALRYQAKGAQSMTDLWKLAQHWAEYLRREGRLEKVAHILGFGYVQESHPNELNYYLERCDRVGDLKAWRLLDKNAVEAARKHGLMKEIERRAPRRPRKGYPTVGGHCRTLPELAVARLLEANDIPFVTQLDYPFTFPRGLSHKSKCDFYLTQVGAYLEVWSVGLEDTSSHWEQYRVRRRFKTSMCERLNLRLLSIEGALLFRSGIEVYLAHIGAVLEASGVAMPVRLGRTEALDPKPADNRLGSRK